MPWARIPPDKLINLPLFGIDVIQDDGDFVWMRGARGRMHVDKRAPRIWFETIEDAHQAGSAAIRITSEAEEADYHAIVEQSAGSDDAVANNRGGDVDGETETPKAAE